MKVAWMRTGLSQNLGRRFLPPTHRRLTQYVLACERRWEYKWRGSETGEGELQIEFECQMGSITFGGPGGTELFGEFESSLTDRIDFTGRKIRNDSIQVDDLSYEWKNSGEMEYERRRVARWH